MLTSTPPHTPVVVDGGGQGTRATFFPLWVDPRPSEIICTWPPTGVPAGIVGGDQGICELAAGNLRRACGDLRRQLSSHYPAEPIF
jgi:hypothetical protein